MEEKFRFISHEKLDDPYIHEVVYLELDGKYRVAFIRKQAKNGGMFWTAPSLSCTKNGTRQYLPAFMFDSKFLSDDIKSFLEKGVWNQQANDLSVDSKESSPNELPF